MLGEGAVFHSFALVELVAAFVVGVNVFVLLYEEPRAPTKLGGVQEVYCKRVPRWLAVPSQVVAPCLVDSR